MQNLLEKNIGKDIIYVDFRCDIPAVKIHIRGKEKALTVDISIFEDVKCLYSIDRSIREELRLNW